VSLQLEEGQWLVQLAAHDVRTMPHEQLVGGLRSGGIFPGVFVWRTGMSEWLAAGTVPALTNALRSAPAAPAGPGWVAAEPSRRAPRQEYALQRPEYALPRHEPKPPHRQDTRPPLRHEPPRQQHEPPHQQHAPWRPESAPGRQLRAAPAVSMAPARGAGPPIHVTLIATAASVSLAVLLTSYALALGGVFTERSASAQARSP